MENQTTSQESDAAELIDLVTRFNDALNAQDVDGMLRLMTAGCVFENTYPAPDGTRYFGQRAVRLFWEDFFHSTRQPRIEIEEIFACGERCVMRWIFHWLDDNEVPGHVRGVDIYKARGELISEKLSYIKG